jgi:putative PIN family toxin of toxin-antitoxin system
MKRVVLDTNVLVSALLKSDGNERQVLRLGLSGRIQLLVSDPIFEEYRAVLPRPRFKLTASDVSETLERLRDVAEQIVPSVTLAASVDPADNRFLECAESGHADYLVTGNKRHFPPRWKNARIVAARELLRFIVPKRP